MRITLAAGVSLMGMMAPGCAGAPAPPQTQDVAFVRGCWVEKDKRDERVNAFLRLLPDGPDGGAFAGYLQYVRGAQPLPQVHIAIARDGARASLNVDGERREFVSDPVAAGAAEDGSLRIRFTGTSNDGPGAITAMGGTDRLSVTVLSGVERFAFEGERDGCD